MLKGFYVLGFITFATFAVLLIVYGFQTTNIGFQDKAIAEKQMVQGTYQSTSNSKQGEYLGHREALTSNKRPEHAFEDGVSLTNRLQEEIASFSFRHIENQIADLKAYIYERNLIDHLNQDNLDASEREKAQVMLTRLALLGVEKAKRNLEHLIPEMQVSLAKHQENLARTREIIKD